MRILLFGKNGQVGWELKRALQPLGEVVALGRKDADFNDHEGLRAIVRNIRPDVIVNAVAYTAVDDAETDEELANNINGNAPGVLAEESSKIGALLVHYSTDYVFDGEKDGPYSEQDVPKPLNTYGRSKLLGEQLIKKVNGDYLIFRTSWVYSARGRNFLLTMLRLASERDELSIVGDQKGTPTWARMIADVSVLCIYQSCQERRNGNFISDLYNLTGSGATSWHGFAEAIVSSSRRILSKPFVVKKIYSIEAREYPTPARRPMNSCLSLKKLQEKFALTVPDWATELDLCIEEMQ